MAFDAATLHHLENALSDAFQYHNQLDSFLVRSGVGASQLAAARTRAEARATASGKYPKAPKRFVVQYLLQDLGTSGDAGDRIVAQLVTGVTQMPLTGASDEAKAAIDALKSKIKSDKDVLAEQRAQRAREAADALRTKERAQERARADKTGQRDALRDRFLGLMHESNVQSRGYLFESFLNDLFEFESLDPHRSFRLTGEQIDGSFAWRGGTHLVEAKWTQALVAGAEFGAFLFKIEGKSVNTRGLFVSVNGYSPEAIGGLKSKGALKFVCIDGSHLVRALMSEEGLAPILERVWRHADETGVAYLPASEL